MTDFATQSFVAIRLKTKSMITKTGIFVIGLVFCTNITYAQLKREIKNVEILTTTDISSDDWIIYKTGDFELCFNKEKVLKVQAQIISNIKHDIDTSKVYRNWKKDVLLRNIEIEQFIRDSKQLVLVDPISSNQDFELENPDLMTDTSLNFSDIMCDLLSLGDVEIKDDNVFLENYIKAEVTEYDEYSETTSIQYLTKDSVMIIICPPIIHVDYK